MSSRCKYELHARGCLPSTSTQHHTHRPLFVKKVHTLTSSTHTLTQSHTCTHKNPHTHTCTSAHQHTNPHTSTNPHTFNCKPTQPFTIPITLSSQDGHQEPPLHPTSTEKNSLIILTILQLSRRFRTKLHLSDRIPTQAVIVTVKHYLLYENSKNL